METNNLENQVLQILQKVKQVIIDCDQSTTKIVNKTKMRIDELKSDLERFPLNEIQELAKNSKEIKAIMSEIDTLQNNL